MATPWQPVHFIAIAAAAGIAFFAGRSMAPSSGPADSAANNMAGPLFPTPGNDLAPPRTRPDENQLIAENAEPEENMQRSAPPPAGSGGAPDVEPPRPGGRDRGAPAGGDKPPVDGGDQEPLGPEDE